jgi:hypothetical protein
VATSILNVVAKALDKQFLIGSRTYLALSWGKRNKTKT